MLLIALSPSLKVDVLRRHLPDIVYAWWFVPLRNPAIVSMPLSFAATIAVSLATCVTRARVLSRRCADA